MPDKFDLIRERRLDLWRRAIALFDKTTLDEGPFHAAGYRDFVLEPALDNGSAPDVVGASGAHFVACELSISPSKDLDQLKKYSAAGLTPFLRTLLGGGERTRGASPFFVTTESGWREFPRGINGINVSAAGGTYLPDVSDPSLESALNSWAGFSRPPPSYSLSAVPESDPLEIKKPLAGVLRLAAALGEPLSAEKAARHLSGDLWISFTQHSRSTLTEKVAQLLQQAGQYFEEEAKWDPLKKALLIETVSSSAGRKATERRIAAWLGTRFIEEWAGEEDEEDDVAGDQDAEDNDDEDDGDS